MTWHYLSACLALAVFSLAGTSFGQAAEPNVIVLKQVACQFLEAENGIDHGFKSTKKADCEKINAETAKRRLAQSEPIKLAPGRHLFRVKNVNVPYELGFWIRGSGLSRISLPSISGGGLHTGIERDYEIVLTPGEYIFSCPLNTTPDYRLLVSN